MGGYPVSLYTILLYVHILSAVVSIGPLFALFSILKRIETAEEASLVGYVQSFQAGITAVKHAGHVVVPSGILLIWQGGWLWHTSWVVLTVGMLIGSIVFLAKAFKPTIQTFSTEVFERTLFVKKLRKATWLYIFLLSVMLWLMVAKPILW